MAEFGRADAPKLRLIIMDRPAHGIFWFDYPSAFGSACEDMGLRYDLVRMPHLSANSLGIRGLARIRRLLNEDAQDSIVLFCPGLAEFFISGSHHNIYFSAYRSWFDSGSMRVIPHVWTWLQPDDQSGDLQWKEKPPLKIGFMGSYYAHSTLAKSFMWLPLVLRKWLLQGRHIQAIDLFALLVRLRGLRILWALAFPRLEIVRFLERECSRDSRLEVELVNTEGFSGSGEEKDRYYRNMMESTYVLCPRGCENFSIRLYEALKCGRIPVIWDTDMVLPPEIDWSAVAVVVPYGDVREIRDAIIQDYESRSADDFLARQQLAIATMRNLAGNDWIKAVVREAIALQQARRDAAGGWLARFRPGSHARA